MQSLTLPIVPDAVLDETWRNILFKFAQHAKEQGKKAADLTDEEQIAIALIAGMEPHALSCDIGMYKVTTKYAFKIVDSGDKWSVISCQQRKQW